jgi:uncharacterized protein YuzB (UPF0349 family)
MNEVMPDNWNVNFVSGKMSAKERAQKVSILGQRNPAIITNAKVMTEGVDVPDIDMVAFVDNRESGIDIVQAVGRVTRKSANKETGYVVLPVVMDRKPGQTLEEVAESAEYSTLYRVINALAAEDEDLMAVINEMASARGSGDEERIKAAREDLSRRIIHTGANEQQNPKYLVLSETIERIIETKIVNKLASFRTRVAELNKYLDENGGEYPKKGDKEAEFSDGSSMGIWVNTQRVAYNAGKMPQSRIDLLNSIGFKWVDGMTFEEKVQELYQYLNDNGGKYPAAANKDVLFSDGKPMGSWVNTQRQDCKTGKMPQSRIDLLNSIGFKWVDKEYNLTFEQKVQEFDQYLKDNGGVYPKWGDKDIAFSDGKPMGRWVGTLRYDRKENTLSQEKIDLLNSIGFEWGTISFEHKVQEFDQYLKDNGGRYPKWDDKDSTFSNGTSMGAWISQQRTAYNSNKMPQARIDLLNSIRFKWVYGMTFEEKVQKLYQYLKENGGVYPKNRDKDTTFFDGSFMGSWVSQQRTAYNAGKMSQARIDLLDSIGFEWGAISFEQKVQEFDQYLNDNGSVHPKSNDKVNTFSDGSSMGSWVNAQRTAYNADKMPQDRIKLLNSIGFKWEYGMTFEEKVQEFDQYLKDNGGEYPKRGDKDIAFSDGSSMGSWVGTQRVAYNAKKLPQSRIDLLDSIGFEWEPQKGPKPKSTPAPRTPDNDEDDNRPSMSM